MPSKPPASILLDWMTASAALTPTTEPVAAGVLWRDNGVLTYSAGIPPVVTDQPDDITVAVGETATFTVVATNATSYQWQLDSGGGFANISGATSASYTTPVLALDDSTNEYRCVVTGPGGSVTSNAATLAVENQFLFEDQFGGDLSGWTTVTGSPTVSAGRCSFTGLQNLLKVITGTNELRVRFKINTYAYSAGTPVVLSVTNGTTTYLELRVIGVGWLRIQSYASFIGTAGNSYGYDGSAANLDPHTSFRQAANTDMTVEVAMDVATKSIWVYMDEHLVFAAVDGSASPTAITHVKIGPHVSVTGTISIDDVVIHNALATDVSSGLVRRAPCVLFVAGQSNAKGSSDSPLQTVTEGYGGISYQTAWTVSKNTVQGSQNGPMFDFMNGAEHIGKWELVMVAVGGSGFNTTTAGLDWDATGTPYTKAHEWMTKVVECYEDLAEIIIFWHQGESDVLMTNTAYRDRLQSLFVDFRTWATSHPSISSVKIAMGEIGTFVSGYASVNSGLALVAAADSLVSLASSAGLTHKGDFAHFTNADANTLGQRMATAFNALE